MIPHLRPCIQSRGLGGSATNGSPRSCRFAVPRSPVSIPGRSRKASSRSCTMKVWRPCSSPFTTSCAYTSAWVATWGRRGLRQCVGWDRAGRASRQR